MVAADPDDPVPCLGLLLLGYPLHAAGKPEKQRVEHLPRLTMPVAFVSGTRDSLAGEARADEGGEEGAGSGHLPLARHRGPWLPTVEGQRAHHR